MTPKIDIYCPDVKFILYRKLLYIYIWYRLNKKGKKFLYRQNMSIYTVIIIPTKKFKGDYMSANPTQTINSQEVINKLKNGTNVFLTGGAGVGKSYTLNLVKESFTKPILVAPTGIAAAHIKGETIHSFFGFPVDKEAGMKKLSNAKREELLPIYKKFDLLIIDEISMVSAHLLNWIMRRFEDLGIKLGVDLPVLIVGDFYQIPPISSDKERSGYAFESLLWKNLNLDTINLTKIYRTDNAEFAQVLNELRVGEISKMAKNMLKTLSQNSDDDKYTHLYSTNKKAFWHNKKMLDMIQKRTFIYEMSEEFLGDTEGERKEFLFKQKILRSKFEKKLYLKEGALVMFTHNDRENKIYNGKKGYITKIDENSIYVDDFKVEKEVIDINSYKKIDGEVQKVVIGKVTQYPIKLAYAITIHKSQGMSIDGLCVDLSYIFASGQAYVALSRAMDPKTTKVDLGYKDMDEIFYTDDRIDRFYNLT